MSNQYIHRVLFHQNEVSFFPLIVWLVFTYGNNMGQALMIIVFNTLNILLGHYYLRMISSWLVPMKASVIFHYNERIKGCFITLSCMGILNIISTWLSCDRPLKNHLQDHPLMPPTKQYHNYVFANVFLQVIYNIFKTANQVFKYLVNWWI